MAGSIADNAELYKKFQYVAPTPPSNLIDSNTFNIDFADRKCLNIGLDPTDNFNTTTIHIITRPRHVVISPNFLKKIFSFMGNILSVILDVPDKSRNIIFLSDEINKLSKMVYKGQNMLVVESLIQNGCRVLLSRQDLMILQNLECSIFEVITRKSSTTRPVVLKQLEQVVYYFKTKFQRETDIKDMINRINGIHNEIFISNSTKSKNKRYISQLKLYACSQIAEQWVNSIQVKVCTALFYLQRVTGLLMFKFYV